MGHQNDAAKNGAPLKGPWGSLGGSSGNAGDPFGSPALLGGSFGVPWVCLGFVLGVF